MRSRKLATFASIGAGIAGVLGAHALDYVIVLPNGVHRHELLLQTGHGYWPHAAAIGLVAGILAALASLGAGMLSVNGRASVGFDALTLAMVQSGAFVALEAVERLGSGKFAVALLGPLLIFGVVLQVVVATAVTFVLRLFLRVGETIANLKGSSSRWSVPSARHVFAYQVRRCDHAASSIRRRGPPEPVFV